MRKRIHQAIKYNNLKEMLEKTGKLYGNKPAFVYKTEIPKVFKEITHKEFRDDINALGTSLVNLGLQGKRIAIIGENRYEWGVAYFAAVNGTGVVVPLDKSLPENEIENLIIRSNVECIFYENKYNQTMEHIRKNKKSNLKVYISIDNQENGDVFSEKQLISEGKVLIEKGDRRFLDAEIDNYNMSIMLFTSGTTSGSKAVMLSHENICSNLYDIASTIKLTSEDRFLSFLPMHHTFESTVCFIHSVYVGASIAFCEGIRHIGDNIKDYQITAMISVPLLFEAMYKKVLKGIEKKGKLEAVNKGIKISTNLRKFGIDIRKKVFKDIHANLGGKLRLFVSGGAGLDPVCRKGFEDLGLTIYQGYGLTESSPVIASEDDKFRKIGSIGKAFPSMDVKIIEQNEEGIGELIAKGPSIMLGYYENEEATKEAIDKDGYLHTGDLARMDKDGYIFICGRKKFVIVLKNGKNIYPEELESGINKIEGIKESFVYGKEEANGDYIICAKIVYEPENLKEAFNIEEIKNVDMIKERIMVEVKKFNKTMPPYKYIREISVTDKELIKTTTQKIKRFEEMKEI